MRLTRVLRDVPWRRVLALFVACLVCTALWAEATQVRLASQVIRLHVLANSDSEEDQALKLEVRDRVLETTGALLAGETEPQAAAVLLHQHLDDIAQTAAQEISAQGHDERVEVRLEQTWFPTRQYQGISLPAGNYLALRVLIGAAEGHNWWCMLYPNLCFLDAVHAVLPEKGKQELKRMLTEEEYELCMSGGKIKCRSYFWELFGK